MWTPLTDLNQLEEIKNLPADKTAVIFKHSTRCSISSTAWGRIERNFKQDEVPNVQAYYLDLIAHRDISNKIAEDFNVFHESPQMIIVKNGKSVFDASHLAISYDSIKQNA